MEQHWTKIQSKTGILSIPFRELWQYRGMIWMLVKQNFQLKKKQTILGNFWIVASILVSTGLFSFIFGYIGQFQSDGMPYFLFYMLGNIYWSIFSDCVKKNSTVFLNNMHLFGKIYFPRLTLPLANFVTDLIYTLLRSGVCAVFFLIFFLQGKVNFGGWYILFAPLLLIQSGLLGLAIGLIISSLSTKYRDLSYMVEFGLLALLYTAPIVYPTSQLPELLQKYVFLNPVSAPVEAFRFCLTGSGAVHAGALLYSVLFTLVVLFIGLILFNQTEKTFIDIV